MTMLNNITRVGLRVVAPWLVCSDVRRMLNKIKAPTPLRDVECFECFGEIDCINTIYTPEQSFRIVWETYKNAIDSPVSYLCEKYGWSESTVKHLIKKIHLGNCSSDELNACVLGTELQLHQLALVPPYRFIFRYLHSTSAQERISIYPFLERFRNDRRRLQGEPLQNLTYSDVLDFQAEAMDVLDIYKISRPVRTQRVQMIEQVQVQTEVQGAHISYGVPGGLWGGGVALIIILGWLWFSKKK
uniref:Uncharacterized protein n=1 Tax=Rhipiliopsis peltata TaxID=2320810 RepID=A0A386B192_9CHLO|nr:hypothetical protein [Rhipiliopsis peltata]AYC65471.1 hypothetical protein [Rhipiliopsis peltata]